MKPPSERLPLLFLVHDEFAEWMLTETYTIAAVRTAPFGPTTPASAIARLDLPPPEGPVQVKARCVVCEICEAMFARQSAAERWQTKP